MFGKAAEAVPAAAGRAADAGCATSIFSSVSFRSRVSVHVQVWHTQGVPTAPLSPGNETHYTYTPSDARTARALCFDDVRAERAPWVCGVHGGLGGALGVRVAYFRGVSYVDTVI